MSKIKEYLESDLTESKQELKELDKIRQELTQMSMKLSRMGGSVDKRIRDFAKKQEKQLDKIRREFFDFK